VGETWTATPFRDAWLIARRGGSRYLVMGGVVEPVNFAHSTLDEAYADLQAHVSA
jgi:hypothetical protein